jgi:hypothetical protein
MAPKAAKGNPEVLIHKDVFKRADCIKAQGPPKPPKPPKGDLTPEEMVWPPVIQTLPDIKAAVHYFRDAQTIRFAERAAMEWPTDGTLPPVEAAAPNMVKSASDTDLVRKPKKDVQDLMKMLKGQAKLHTKQSAKFYKQFEKSETKQEKRQVLLDQIAGVEKSIDTELRDADRLAKETNLFARRFVFGSKLGQTCPTNHVAVIAEVSDKMAPYVENATTDIFKFFGHVIEKNADQFHFSLMSSAGVTPHKPNGYQLTFAKTGAADAMKWMGKQFTAKAMAANPWPPKWVEMLEQYTPEDMRPSHLYIVCSKVPQPATDVEDKIREIRASAGIDIPVTVVCYDPEVAGDFIQESFFKTLAGEEGEFIIDNSKAEMEAIDASMNKVKKMRKQLEKLEKKLAKMDDLSETVETNRQLYRVQSSLEKLAKNDLLLTEQALKRPAA